MTATATATLDATIDALFAALGAGDLSAAVPLADALEEAGRTQAAAILRGDDCASAYVVPALGLVTSARPRLADVGDRRGGRKALEVSEIGFGVRFPAGRTFRGKPMHHRSHGSKDAWKDAVSGAFDRLGVLRPRGTKTVLVHVVHAEAYGPFEQVHYA